MQLQIECIEQHNKSNKHTKTTTEHNTKSENIKVCCFVNNNRLTISQAPDFSVFLVELHKVLYRATDRHFAGTPMTYCCTDCRIWRAGSAYAMSVKEWILLRQWTAATNPRHISNAWPSTVRKTCCMLVAAAVGCNDHRAAFHCQLHWCHCLHTTTNDAS